MNGIDANHREDCNKRVIENKGAPGADGLRVDEPKGWLRGNWPTVRAALQKHGLSERTAWTSATNGRGAWWNAGASYMHAALAKSYFDRLGLVSLVDYHQRWRVYS